ncbi:DUF2963 domain-containing protein [Candidatus Phytoplasma tritici]|uniref:DUF2963 domain-containing protein n=1 Tax=Candidatus Phytoplasma tritici TaxID=321961 RepID=UPI00041DE951|nr:DUF2963 domain-containing protein [Candidatus Phytoplasma tritici]
MNGKTIHYIDEFDKDTKTLIKVTNYYDNGTTISSVNEYDNDVKLIKTTYYRPDGAISDIIKF